MAADTDVGDGASFTGQGICTGIEVVVCCTVGPFPVSILTTLGAATQETVTCTNACSINTSVYGISINGIITALVVVVAAGIMAVGDVHGGAIEKGALLLQEGVIRVKGEDLDISEVAGQIVGESREKRKRLPGFGHRVHTADPRTAKLFSVADDLEISGSHVELSKGIEMELEKQTGRKLPINVDGAIAAVMSDMDFDYRLGKAFFLMGRTAGLVAQAYEEMTRERPMRKMYSSKHDYDGPEERDLPEEYR